jgi:manganese transport protein
VTESLIRKASLSERTVSTAREVLSGQRRGMGAYLAFAGPAIVASIAYIDPGNFATNIQAGAKYGYGLLWVVLLANMIAMLFQALSAKLGIVTGRNLAEMCRDRFRQSFSAAPSGCRCCLVCHCSPGWSSPASLSTVS